ncbi:MULTISPECIES: carboxymuconolactone decarboxylase family protein [unclassified Rathayibacter]|uniref:carboxymuconolactone decarboxylase family protein n=1 Tax=unclassified Rathayibacter TaxID=2609250 RepID=UPI001FB448AB|nr:MULTISPECIES: carboxymuconolactone decarboxylase family protein [unclassified Rathayibacter]MCJ1674599.1 carboxymuconolactone decarboxylase family protein [Rathayibacter sp. VKM Ac-2929]MCJ1684880.1 carboxymuconolactone decarboxylase family protein [Rathayibacter sp. VKM Ac-2928]
MTAHEDALAEFAILFPARPDPDGTSLGATDPEFFAFYRDFAFGETLGHVDLDRRERLLYQLAACIAVGAAGEFRVLLGVALEVGVPPVQVKEVTYQAVAYVGSARGIEFIALSNEILTAHGIALPLEGQSTTTPETRREAGLDVQTRIFGPEVVDGLFAGPADTRRFSEFLAGHCFGDHYTRTGLDVKQRELVTFALLAALGGADSQVKSHVTANLKVGSTRGDLLEVLTVLVAYIGYPRTLNALAQVNAAAPAET